MSCTTKVIVSDCDVIVQPQNTEVIVKVQDCITQVIVNGCPAPPPPSIWPLLAPTSETPQYSFEDSPETGVYYGDSSLNIKSESGDFGKNISIVSGDGQVQAGSFTIKSGSISGFDGGTAGNFLMQSGDATADSEPFAGNFIMRSGNAIGADGNAGYFSIIGGSGSGSSGGNVVISGGTSDVAPGSVVLSGGSGGGYLANVEINSSLFVLANMTSAQRDAIPSGYKKAGSILFNDDNGVFELYDGTSFYESPKIIKASATLNFPSTAVNSSSDLTVTVTGAAVGDVVAVAPGLAAISAGSCFTAWVSAANTVTVRFNHYNAGGTTDPVSAVFNIIVTKF